jgi:hypothetical protein
MSVSYGGDKITFEDGSTVGSGWAGFKNRIINGTMVIDQRNNGANVTSNTASATAFPVDRFQINMSSDATVTGQRTTDAPTGFSNSVRLTVTTADTSIDTNQYVQFYHSIEGYNIADLNYGTSSAATVTVSFWVKSSVAGQYPTRLVNGNGSRSYTFYTTINEANTWEYKTKVVPGPTSGTFDSTNGTGITLGFTFAAGTFFAGATENVWNNTVSFQNSHLTAPVNWIGTAGNTFFVTGVQLEKGSTATSFDYRPYGTELALCQRYFYTTSGSYGFGFTTASGQWLYRPGYFPVSMRTTPSMSYTGATDGTWGTTGTGRGIASISPTEYSIYYIGDASRTDIYIGAAKMVISSSAEL